MAKINKTNVLNYLTIAQKMVLIFLGSVILPLAIQNAFYYSDTEKNIQSEMMQRLNSSLDEVTDKMNGCIAETITLSHRYNSNEELYKFLDRNYTSDIDYFVEYQNRIRDMLFLDLAYNQHVRKISLYTDNPTILNGSLVNKMEPGNSSVLGENLLDCRLYNLTTAENGPKLQVSIAPLAADPSNDRYFSIVRPMKYYPQYVNHHKFLRIDMDVSYIASLMKESPLFDNVVLVDTDNRIVASANTYHPSGKYDLFSEDTLTEGIVVLKDSLNVVPLTLYGYYDSKIISDEFTKMRWKTIGIAFISMTLALFCILLIAGNITKRTKLVENLSKQIAKGNFIQINRSGTGNDEIEVLADSMNKMSMKLKTLIEEEYHSRILKAQLERETAQAKLLALQSQVNPHFMFNALESIRPKAMVKNETETARMILYMARMFRHLITWNDDIIQLQDEIKFLNEFLNIQKYRFDDEFEYTVKIDESAQDCLLPKFIIQPLVENACVHGVEAISNNKLVEICVVIKENRVDISVCDNGSGIGEESLNRLRAMLKGSKELTKSVGLYNVYQRLVLYYGSEFSFDISSEIGRGTKINITVPIRHSKEEFYVLHSSC